jgi:hypothetical protein
LALPPDDNDAFRREVDDELRRDQLGTLWERYGKLAIGAIVVALAIFGGVLWWQADRAKQAGLDGETYTTALKDIGANKPDVKAKLDALAKSPRDGYRATAALTLAAQSLEKGDVKDAASRYDTVAADTSLPQPFRDLAVIRSVAAQFDTMPPDRVIAKLKPYAVPGNPWFGSAGEMTAVAYLKQNKPRLAGAVFAQLAKDESVPPSGAARARQIAGTLGVDAVAGPAAGKE